MIAGRQLLAGKPGGTVNVALIDMRNGALLTGDRAQIINLEIGRTLL